MIQLHQYPPMFGIPNPSPFCMKLETWLRMSGLPFEIVPVSDPRKGPKGKLPWIDDGGKVVADSGFIIDYLKQKYGDKLDARLDEGQRGVALALRRLIEEHLYWVIASGRFLDGEIWPQTKTPFLTGFPAPLRPLIGRIVRRSVAKSLRLQGLGRHSREELYQVGAEDLAALAAVLGDKPYFFGDTPTEIDATAYGFLAQILWAPGPRKMREALEQHPNLVAFCERMKKKYYDGGTKP